MNSGGTRKAWNSTLRRKKPMSNSPSFAKNGVWKQRKPLKKMSRSRKHRLEKYSDVRREFLSRPENADCRICIKRREAGENIRLQPATEIHHLFGRANALLNDERGFIPSCRACRDFPHAHPALAREMGLLAPANQWGVPIDRH